MLRYEGYQTWHEANFVSPLFCSCFSYIKAGQFRVSALTTAESVQLLMATSFPRQRELGLSSKENYKFHCQESWPIFFPVFPLTTLHPAFQLYLTSSARGEVLRLVRVDGKGQSEKEWHLHSYWATQRSVLVVELLAEPCSAHPRGDLGGSRTGAQQSPTTAIPGGLVTDFSGNRIQSWGSKTLFYGLCRMVGVTLLSICKHSTGLSKRCWLFSSMPCLRTF